MVPLSKFEESLSCRLLPGSFCMLWDRNSSSVHFSLSARHSSESSPAHHLFYNEAHHSYVLWVPIKFGQFSHSEELNQKSPNFFLRVELSLLSTGHSVHVLKNQAVTSTWHLLHQLSFLVCHLHHHSIDLYIRSQTYMCIFRTHSMQFALNIKRIPVCLLNSSIRERGNASEFGFHYLKRDKNGLTVPWFWD